MDINLLVLNLGNSRLAIGVFHAGELVYSNHIGHEQKSDWPAAIQLAWQQIAKRSDAAVAGASVNPGLVESLEHAVQQVTGKQVEWVGKDLELPIKVLTDNPQQTGVDRVVTMAAAYEQMQKACVVVDAGTAVTINVCNDAGEFLGGSIAPGVSMILESLHEKTAKLPRVEFAVPSDPIAKSTEQAILYGAFHGIRGMVKEIVENYATELGSWPDLIATGGDAPRLFEDWELVHAISPDLALYGIALAYTNHHIKHNT